jgi:hypothetical protein
MGERRKGGKSTKGIKIGRKGMRDGDPKEMISR